MKVYILDRIHEDAVRHFQKIAPEMDLVLWGDPGVSNWHDDADGVIVRASPVTGEDIRKSRKLKVIGRHGVGYEKVDMEAAKEKGVAVLFTPFENTNAVAELVMTLMLACARNIPLGMEVVKEGHWKDKNAIRAEELTGKSMGFVGYGRIARSAADLLSKAFCARIHAYDPYVPAEEWNDLKPSAIRSETIEDLFAACDVVSVHVPLTPETRGLIGKKAFSAARPGAILVNTARGGVVCEEDLYEALKTGTLLAAASDVFAKEPPEVTNPLFSLPNFIPTPHFGGNTQQALERVAAAVVREVAAYLHGEGDPRYRVI